MQSETFSTIKSLIQKGEVLISSHGYDELAEDDIWVADLFAGVDRAKVLEDYPDFHKGPSCLVLQDDGEGHPIHAVWGIAKDTQTPAVLITAYRPDPAMWSEDFKRRKSG
jgi:hypothetical protein